VVSRYKPILDERQQNLVVTLAADLPPLRADASRLEQVIVNLLSNASKFSPPKSDLGLTVKRNDGELLFEVKDSGIGISAENQKTLFEPYYRVKQESNNYPGTGLGLAVCRQIVEAHGGKISVDSQPGKGSTFAFTIPLEEKK
jgi:signal transduction histidine kinase